MLCVFLVLPAIDFDCKFLFATIKINDVRTQAILSLELQAKKSAFFYLAPKIFLSLGRMKTEFAAKLFKLFRIDDAFHANIISPLTPQPLPHAWGRKNAPLTPQPLPHAWGRKNAPLTPQPLPHAWGRKYTEPPPVRAGVLLFLSPTLVPCFREDDKGFLEDEDFYRTIR
jgi:hypothetical protein